MSITQNSAYRFAWPFDFWHFLAIKVVSYANCARKCANRADSVLLESELRESLDVNKMFAMEPEPDTKSRREIQHEQL